MVGGHRVYARQRQQRGEKGEAFLALPLPCQGDYLGVSCTRGEEQGVGGLCHQAHPALFENITCVWGR